MAESLKFNGTSRKQKSSKITESFASKAVASTAPSKEVITESTNVMKDSKNWQILNNFNKILRR